MRAAVLREVGEPLSLEDVDLDEPRAGEVMVRIEAAGVCHNDLHYMNGDPTGKVADRGRTRRGRRRRGAWPGDEWPPRRR